MPDEQKSSAIENEDRDIVEELEPMTDTKNPSLEDYQELNNRYLRLAADFENFRKRQAQERESMFKYGAQNTLEALLPVLDNLQRGQQSLSENSDPKMLYKSFEMLSQQMLDSLKSIGLEKMAPKGQTFDPERHEAVSQVENSDVPDHTILDVYQDGYLLYDRVIRPAQVVVSVMPEKSQTNNGPVPAGSNFEATSADKSKNPFQKAQPLHGNTPE